MICSARWANGHHAATDAARAAWAEEAACGEAGERRHRWDLPSPRKPWRGLPGLPDAVAGQIVDARPDVVLSHDNTAAIARIFRELGAGRVQHPERLAITLDHAVPAPTTQHAANHAEVRRFVAEQGIPHFFEAGRGICHQVLSEEALVWPGQLILGADSHTTHFGWLGAFGAGVGRSEMAAIWATGELWLRVPETILVHLTGRLPPWVTRQGPEPVGPAPTGSRGRHLLPRWSSPVPASPA